MTKRPGRHRQEADDPQTQNKMLQTDRRTDGEGKKEEAMALKAQVAANIGPGRPGPDPEGSLRKGV